MRVAASIIAIVALAAPAAAHAQAPLLRAKLTSCLSGPDATDRTATFTGSMPRIKGTKRMWMRFDLQARTPPATSYKTIKVPGLGVWQKSATAKSSSGFVFNQRVQALAAPGAYRVTVRFRWYGRSGKLLRSTSRQSATCTQPDQRPDLRAGDLGGVLGPGAGQATYYLERDRRGAARGGRLRRRLLRRGRRAARPARGGAGGRRRPGRDLRRAALRSRHDAALRPRRARRGRRVSESDDVVERPCPFVAETGRRRRLCLAA